MSHEMHNVTDVLMRDLCVISGYLHTRTFVVMEIGVVVLKLSKGTFRGVNVDIPTSPQEIFSSLFRKTWLDCRSYIFDRPGFVK